LTLLALGDLVPLGLDLVVTSVQTFGLRAVKVEPPIADKVLLVEDGAVGAKERLAGESSVSGRDAHVEGLAVGLGVGVVSSFDLSIALKAEVSKILLSVDGVVSTGLAGNGVEKPVETLVVSLVGLGQLRGGGLRLVGGLLRGRLVVLRLRGRGRSAVCKTGSVLASLALLDALPPLGFGTAHGESDG
jgi:hypothetical protein